MLGRLKKFVKPSISDAKGGLSSRKITAFVSFTLLIMGYLMHIFKGTEVNSEFIWMFGGLAGVNFGWITWQNVIAMKNGGSI